MLTIFITKDIVMTIECYILKLPRIIWFAKRVPLTFYHSKLFSPHHTPVFKRSIQRKFPKATTWQCPLLLCGLFSCKVYSSPLLMLVTKETPKVMFRYVSGSNLIHILMRDSIPCILNSSSRMFFFTEYTKCFNHLQ